MQIYHNVSMSQFTTWGVGAVARQLMVLETNDDVRRAFDKHPDAYILGNGSNILVVDNVDTVVKLGRQFDAAKHVHALANQHAAASRSGLEFLMGIPATVGGAIKTNAGGRYGSMRDVVRSVEVYHQGEIKTITPMFGYRSSDIQGLILSAEFHTERTFPETIRDKMREVMQEKSQTQPLGSASAGCTFKNPAIAPAAKLIDDLGLKGKEFGGAKISELHANFIVTKDGSPQDVLEAIRFIRERVFDRYGIELELEVEIWPLNQTDLALANTATPLHDREHLSLRSPQQSVA